MNTPEQIRNELDQDEPRSSFPQYHTQSRQDRDAELVAYDQMGRESARAATENDERGPQALPDATGAGEALVQQIAEVIVDAALNAAESGWAGQENAATLYARAVLPLVEAQVAPLRDALTRVRALADSFADDDAPRYGGNIAWHIEEAIANEKGDFPDAADRRIASQRERADAAESALRQVREDLTATIEREGKLHSTWDKRSEMVVPVEALSAVLARVGVADTQPEGAVEVHPGYTNREEYERVSRELREARPGSFAGSSGPESDGRASLSIAPTPTAGGKVDTAPEATS